MGFTDLGVPCNTKLFPKGRKSLRTSDIEDLLGGGKTNKKEITIRESLWIGSRERLVLYDLYVGAIVTIRNV